MRSSEHLVSYKAIVIALLLFQVIVTACSIKKNNTNIAQNPSPMQDFIRAHDRVSIDECIGKRIGWMLGDKKVQLFIPQTISNDSPNDLIIHFHGNPRVTEFSICKSPDQILLTVTGGFGSRSYEQLFDQRSNFTTLLDHIEKETGISQFASITISGWSAGYGAIRAILVHHEEQISNVILLDGIHASYIPENQVLHEGGQIDASDLKEFLDFAKKAVQGEKKMLITHSSIFPGTYASTTESTQYLIDQLSLKRTPVLVNGPVGMQQVGVVQSNGLTILSFAGNTAPDHIDHIHGLGHFLAKLLRE